MAERPNPPSVQESSPLHERGPLTSEHWQELLPLIEEARSQIDSPSIITPRETEESQRIIEYGQAVIDRRIKDTIMNNALFLGRRHLSVIASVVFKAIKHSQITSPKLKEVDSFFHDQYGSPSRYTCDDYYYYMLSYHGRIPNITGGDPGSGVTPGCYQWSEEHQMWRRYYYYYNQDGPSGVREDSGFFHGHIDRAILQHFLLEKNELKDPKRMRVVELLAFIKDNIAVEVLNKRFSERRYKGKLQNIWELNTGADRIALRDWEKPIPKAV
ncbi:MAG: hypothetical protein A3B44_01040 [Candidatus Levybacteria bacterium RIFCSPLOWO2_01_FULL_38_21]|nr:MAG: hypothetical protein A3B44_01040 [Candidatus Levybacteria bacterium RIFCSPLOWO2_01_FULL_38_21]